MEYSFGRPLDHIRVHHDARAGAAAAALHSDAFAQRNALVFGPGRYRPDSRDGFRLLAHEVAHSLQPGGGGQSGSLVSQPSEPAERAAERAADLAVRGEFAGAQIGAGLDTRGRIMRRAMTAEIPANPAPLRGSDSFQEASAPAVKPPVPPEPKPLDPAPKPPAREAVPQDASPEHPAIAVPERPTEEEATEITGPVPEQAPPPEEMFAAEEEEIETEPEGPSERPGEEGAEQPAAEAGGPGGKAGAPGREAARARVDAAIGRVRDAFGVANSIGNRPVLFGQTEEEKSADPVNFFAGLGRRHRAEQMGSSFLARNAGQVSRILTQAQSAVPAIVAASGQARRQAGRAARSSQAALVSQVAGSRANVAATGASTTGRIAGREEAGRAQAHTATETARSAVETAHASASDGVEPLESAQRSRIEQTYQDGDRSSRDIGVNVGGDAMTTARDYERDWLGQRNGESSILDGPIHDNRLEARAEAAVKVGEAYQTELEKAANQQADQGLEGQPRDMETVGSSGEECRATLESQWQQADTGLADGGAAAEQSVGGTGRPFRSNARRSASAASGALDGQLTAQSTALSSYEAQQTEAIDRDADLAVAALMEGAADAAERLSQPLMAYLQEALGTPAPEGRDLGLVQGELDGIMGAVVSEVFTRFGAGIELSRVGVQQGGDSVSATMASLAQAGTQQAAGTEADAVASLEALLGQAATALGGVVNAHLTGSTQQRDIATAGLGEVLAGIEQLFDTYGVNLAANFEQAAQGLDTGLRAELGKEPGVIEEKAQEAADQVQPRWKSVLKVLLVIAVILVVALVVGPAVIGFVGAAAGTLGASAAVAGTIGTIVGGAIVGAAAGATIQLGNNIIDGKEDIFEGVGKAAVVGAISGAFGGIGSAVSGSVGASLGTVGQTVLRGGIDLAFDVGGGIVADLAVGNPITLEGVLTGAAIGLGVSAAGANLGRFGSAGRRAQAIQQGAMGVGEGLGRRAGGAIRGAVGVPPIETGPAPRVHADEPAPPSATAEPPRPVEEPAAAPRTGEGDAGPGPRAQEPEAPAPRPQEPEPPAPRAEQPEAAAPRAEEPEPPAPRPEEPEPAVPRSEEPGAASQRPDTGEGLAPHADEQAGSPRPAEERGGDRTPDADAAAPRTEPERTPPRPDPDKARIIRQDDDFEALVNHKGKPKSHLDADGNMVPNNADGTTTPLEHIYGMDPAKSDSPFTSFLAEGGGTAKTYGSQEVELDLARLRADIESGALPNVEVVTPDELSGMIRTEARGIAPGVDFNAAVARGPAGIPDYVATLGLSRGKSQALARRILALYNTMRDGEYLIRGVIPKRYLRGPSPTGG